MNVGDTSPANDAAHIFQSIQAQLAGIFVRADIVDALGIAEQANGGAAGDSIRHMALAISDAASDLAETVTRLALALPREFSTVAEES